MVLFVADTIAEWNLLGYRQSDTVVPSSNFLRLFIGHHAALSIFNAARSVLIAIRDR
jgi:hypothetical protein